MLIISRKRLFPLPPGVSEIKMAGCLLQYLLFSSRFQVLLQSTGQFVSRYYTTMLAALMYHLGTDCLDNEGWLQWISNTPSLLS